MFSFPKSVLALAFVSASLFAADYSKHSLTELQNLAGKVKPADALDYKIEIRKRINAMSVKDARAFMQKIRDNTIAAHDKMTREELRQYKIDVCKANMARIDSMNVQEARELGLLKKQYLMQNSQDVCAYPAAHAKNPKKQPRDLPMPIKQSREPL